MSLYTNVTDRQTNDTGRQQRPRLRIASRCKKNCEQISIKFLEGWDVWLATAKILVVMYGVDHEADTANFC